MMRLTGLAQVWTTRNPPRHASLVLAVRLPETAFEARLLQQKEIALIDGDEDHEPQRENPRSCQQNLPGEHRGDATDHGVANVAVGADGDETLSRVPWCERPAPHARKEHHAPREQDDATGQEDGA